VNQDDLQVFRADIRVVRQNSPRKVVQSASQFDTRESTTRDDEGEFLSAKFGICFPIRLLEHVDHAIANANGV
jgi:hypothetical protein